MKKEKRQKFKAELSMAGETAVLDVAGIIGWDADALQFNDLVDRAKESGATNLTVRINSVGGYCYDGLSMGDKLRTCGMATRGEVYGTAMSMASYLLQCCDVRVAHENATLMFHQPSACICGTVDEMLQEAQYLVGMRDRMFEQMGARCGKSGAELSAEHMTTKYYTASEALDYGFLDAIAGKEGDTAGGEDTPAEDESERIEEPMHAGARVFAYERGLRAAMMEDTDEESADEESADEESADEESGDEESGDEESGDEESGDEESGDEESSDEESGDEESADEEKLPTPKERDAEGAEARGAEVLMTRAEIEELVARRTAEAVAALGVPVAGLPRTGAAAVTAVEYSREELDAMPAMARLRVLRENPTLAARYINK